MRLQQAEIYCLRIFDIGEAMQLDRAAALLSTQSSRLKLTRQGSEYIQLANPPLSIDYGTRSLPLAAGSRDVKTVVRLYDHGAMTVRFEVAVTPGTTLEELIPFADELYDSDVIEQAALKVMTEVKRVIEPSIEDPHLWEKNEEYTVIHAREIEGKPAAADLKADPALPRLLLGETKKLELSETERRDIVSHGFSYSTQDLTVVDWNAAFVYEPDEPGTDTLDLLEIANAQLCEFRYYDDTLDKELNKVHEVIGSHRRPGLFNSPYKQLLRDLALTLIELSEFIERVENTLRIVGDTYLAKVYEGALQQLRVKQWQTNVSRKQSVLNHTYELLKGEVDTDRTLTLEIAVVVLIVIEVLVALLPFVPH